jgi:hypothetical protein
MGVERIAGWFRSNGDLAVGGGAAILFVAALTLAPKAGCSPVYASAAFKALAWASGLGLLLAGVLGFLFRTSSVAKAGMFLAGLVAAMLATAALVWAAFPNGFGFQDSERGTPTMQEALRGLATSAPQGRHAYWLGKSFRGATVTLADCCWTDVAQLSYAKSDGVSTALDFDVATYDFAESPAHRTAFPTEVRMRAATSEEVTVFFRTPDRPDAALIRETRAALQKIPADVTYGGCAS